MPGPDLTPGFFGKLPAAGDFVSWNLPKSFTDRWDRWMSMELAARPDTGPLDPRAWRFIVPADIFGNTPAAGVWRMSEDRARRRFPLVVARPGPPPPPGDPWFDGAGELLTAAVEKFWPPAKLADRLRGLAPPAATAPETERIVFWLDDWEVQELRFADIRDLAATGLPAMRAARAAIEEA